MAEVTPFLPHEAKWATSIGQNSWAEDEAVQVGQRGRPGGIRGSFNRAAAGRPGTRGSFNRAAARPSARRSFNSAARGPRSLPRTGKRLSSIRQNARLRAQFKMSARQMTRKGPAVFRSKMAGQFRASALGRVTPPRQVTSALVVLQSDKT